MDVKGIVPDSINCHSCGKALNLAGQTGFAHLECPHCGALSVVPMQFGNFMLLNPVGLGGMGTVYKAMDLSLNRLLAVKILRQRIASDPEFIQSFAREARAAAAVNHPNVAQVYSFSQHDGQYYLAMELLERGSLDDRITKLGKVPERDVLEIAAQITAALNAAHQRGLLHRDIKPGNILFNDQGAAKIVDFGLARVQSTDTHQPPGEQGQVWGTPYYIAPEKLQGKPEDFRSDMYSLGATLFHALAGRPPFEAATAGEVVAKHAGQPAYSLKTFAPEVHDYTAHIIGRMLAKNPDERYESYSALLHDIHQAIAAAKAVESGKEIVTTSGERFSAWAVMFTFAGLIIVVLLSVFVWWKVIHQKPPVTTTTTTVVNTGTSDTTTTIPNGQDLLTEQVDFTENHVWVKAWDLATEHLAKGNTQDALLNYENALAAVGYSKPKARQWIFYYEGLSLLAANRFNEAPTIFLKSVDPRATPRMPTAYNTGTLVDMLSHMMVGMIPMDDVENALSSMPPWAHALSVFSIALKRMEAGNMQVAAELLTRYQQMPVEDDNRWAYKLQPLADRLARDCQTHIRLLADVQALTKEQRFEEALQLVNTAYRKIKHPVLKKQFDAQRADLEKAVAEHRAKIEDPAEIERKRQLAEQERIRAEQERQQRIEEEIKTIQAVETQMAGDLAVYDFAAANTKIISLRGKVQTAEAGRKFEQITAHIEMLMAFKETLKADFKRRPYDREDLQTRTGTKLAGRLGRATETELIFETRFGELVINWRDMIPSALVKLAEFYTLNAPGETKTQLANRHLALAVFCKQYGLDRAVTGYARRAIELSPDLAPKVELIFGPL